VLLIFDSEGGHTIQWPPVEFAQPRPFMPSIVCFALSVIVVRVSCRKLRVSVERAHGGGGMPQQGERIRVAELQSRQLYANGVCKAHGRGSCSSRWYGSCGSRFVPARSSAKAFGSSIVFRCACDIDPRRLVGLDLGTELCRIRVFMLRMCRTNACD
jgi:hypothetical protein